VKKVRRSPHGDRLYGLVAIVHPGYTRATGKLLGRIHHERAVYPAYTTPSGHHVPERSGTPCGLSLDLGDVHVVRFEGFADEVTCDDCRRRYETGRL